MKTTAFKTCTTCSTSWNTLDAFLADPQVELIGYQANMAALEEGMFCFIHQSETCGTTMAIPVKMFKTLSDLPVLAPSAISRPTDCMKLCLNEHELGECPEKCNCNWVRNIMQTIRSRKKTTN